jgi:RNase P subunit RPR2
VGNSALNNGNFNKWYCRNCRRLLAVTNGVRLEIRNGQGDNFLVGFPVTCVCRNPHCNTINELRNTQQSNVGAADEGLSQPRREKN